MSDAVPAAVASPVLTGDARRELHHRLFHLLRHPDVLSDVPGARAAADIAAAEAARVDPSVLAHKLNRKFGPRVARAEGSDLAVSETSDTWCMYAAKHGHLRLLAVGLEAGIHPDDPEVFLYGGVLSYESCLRDPKLLRLALERGASPASRVQPAGRSNRWRKPTAQFLLDELVNSLEARRPDALQLAQGVMELLLAGARIGTPTREERGVHRSYANQNVTEALMAISARIGTPEAATHLPPLIEWLGLGLDSAFGLGTGSAATEFVMRLHLAQLASERAAAHAEGRLDQHTQDTQATPSPKRRARMGV